MISDTLTNPFAPKRQRSPSKEENVSMTERRPYKKGKSVAKVGYDEKADQIEVCSDKDGAEVGDIYGTQQEPTEMTVPRKTSRIIKRKYNKD